MVPLTSGVTYYTTIRAITNAGNILQTVTDGITPDISPPDIELERQALLVEFFSLASRYECDDLDLLLHSSDQCLYVNNLECVSLICEFLALY